MAWGRIARRSAQGVMAGLLLASCAPFNGSGLPGSAAALAQDQIMLVRPEPPSFGFRRLLTQSQAYPDLRLFVETQGLPDFLAETGDRQRHYLILYYLSQRRAFACRTRQGQLGAVEFAGPYPITDGEFKLLDGFRRATMR